MKRRLSAMLAADVVGYSKMIAQDEAATLSTLESLRSEVFGPVFADNAGRIVKSMGDGWLVEFQSAVNAVTAAMQVQDRLRAHPTIRLRMGLHIGDVTQNAHDLYGDGINIAARLESIAPEGGVMISDAVYSSLDGTLSPSFEAAGPQTLKNIARPVTAWLRAGTPLRAATDMPSVQATSALPVLNVHPTANSDPRGELQDLADALTADLASYFGSINWLQGRISGSDAATGYHLRPMLRARGDRLRLETRLLTPAGATLWTHKSQSTLDDAFDWQDNVVGEVADHCIGMILEAETTRITAVPDSALTAEQCVLMGIVSWRDFSHDSFIRSAAFHERAMQTRPDMADAYAEGLMVVLAARTMTAHPGIKTWVDKIPEWMEAGRPHAAGHPMLSLAIAIATYTQDARPLPLRSVVEQTLRNAPFDARILSYCGWANLWCGHTQDAYDCFVKSLEFGRLGPFYVAALGGAATACVQLGQDAEALDYLDQGFALSDSYPTYYASKSAALAHLGRLEEARDVMAKYRTLEPGRTVDSWRTSNGYGGSEGGARYFEGLRLAGLPER